MKRALISTFAVLACLRAAGAEVDHYSWSSPLADSSAKVNELAKSYLAKAIHDLNAAGECDDSVQSETALYNEMGKYFANHSKGKLVKDLLHGQIEGVDTRAVSIKDSVYSDWAMTDGFLLGRPGAGDSRLGLSPLIRIGDTQIGVDKFEHMFGMGRVYFTSHYHKEKSVLDVLRNGVFREKTSLGGNRLATGVFSYGDLAANFNGMRFWNHVLQKRDDVLGAEFNVGPYVRCESGKWAATETAIDFRRYVDASMDESVNCRKFASKGGLEKSKRAMSKRNSDACPNNKELNIEIFRKYSARILNEDPKKRPLAHWIINLDGMGVIDYIGEFEKKSLLPAHAR